MNNRLSCNPPLNPPQSSGVFARLLAVRVLANKATNILETKEPRRFPIEFEGPARDHRHVRDRHPSRLYR